MALWDLKSRRAGLPLWNFLGGYDPRVPCYAGGIDLDLPLDALLRQTDGNLGKGFRAIKMKVGRKKLSEDVERVRAMREHLGADFPLMADANMKWGVDEAIRAARALQPFDLTWLEEPTIPDDLAGHARILRDGGVPIATGENLRTLWEFKLFIAGGAVSFPEPDATNCGGVTPFMKIARLAEAFNLPVTSHGAHDVTVHLLAACPNRSYLEAHGFGLDRYIADPLAIEDGVALAPDRPGHGIAFDWAGLAEVAARGPKHAHAPLSSCWMRGLGGRSGMDVALSGRIKSPHAEVRGRRPSLEARNGGRALHRQGCVLRGSRSLAPQDEELRRMARMKDPRRLKDPIDDRHR